MDFRSQINDESDPLIACTDLQDLNIEDGYSVVPLVHSSWKTSKKRLLVVVETIDSKDLHEGELLSGTTEDPGSFKGERSSHNPMRTILSNILDKAVELLKPYELQENSHDYTFSFGITNYNARKIRDLDRKLQLPYLNAFDKRLMKVIKRLKPTHILVFGDTPARFLIQSLEDDGEQPVHLQAEVACKNSVFKRGWVFHKRVNDQKVFLCPTLDLETLYRPKADRDLEDEEEEGSADKYAAADLLYFVTRNICNLFAERMLHDLSWIKPNPVYVDTIEKFDALYEKLLECEMFATDTETKNLTNSANKIYFAQFAMSAKRGYVVPIYHPKTPFTEEESAYIYKKIRRLLLSKDSKIIVTLNGVFDLRIYRTQLGIPIVPYHKVWEVTAGEQLLDENLGTFSRHQFYFFGEYIKTSYQNLRNLFCYYGNDLYYRLPFSKEERNTTGNLPPDDPDVLNYASLDVQSLMGIVEEQKKRAEAKFVLPKLKAKRVRYSKYFETHLLNQMSNTVQGISAMEENGSPIDIEYLTNLMGDQSPLRKVIQETMEQLCSMPSVKEANKRILSSAGKATSSLFGDDISMNVFDPNKKAHKETLLFDVLKLKVVGYTKTKQRAIDKRFIAAYKDSQKEVAMLETISKTSKLLSTYVKGWYNKIHSSLDSIKDFCLRPSFGFFTVVTGRLNSFDPSLQQVPSRGPSAKYIKRAFVALHGHFSIKYDYSAHEIRGWSILSGDSVIANSFRAGLNLRKKLIKELVEEVREELRKSLKKDGDFHIQSVFRIFGKWVEKSSPLRDIVKALVFGLIYGKGTRTLAKDINKDVEEAQEIINKLFEEFPVGAQYLEDVMKIVEREGQVMSPFGRVRHLWRVYTGKKGVIAAAKRRSQNAPIQGFSSETGCSAAQLICLESYKFIKKHRLDMEENWPKYNRAVHDANYFQVPFAFVIPFIHIQQHMSTVGVTQWFKEVFGFEFSIEPEIEQEICASEDKSYKWSWEIPELLTQIYDTLLDLVELGRLNKKEVDSTFELILQPWRSVEMREELCRDYPLLGVPGLEYNIKIALKQFKPPVREAAKKAA